MNITAPEITKNTVLRYFWFFTKMEEIADMAITPPAKQHKFDWILEREKVPILPPLKAFATDKA